MEPWLSKLHEGDVEGAWDCFIERYRRLIFATIRHYAEDYDDVMDIFAWVCESLRQDDLARLRRYPHPQQKTHRARFSTWLVAVVRNQTIDWFRHRKGRQRLSSFLTKVIGADENTAGRGVGFSFVIRRKKMDAGLSLSWEEPAGADDAGRRIRVDLHGNLTESVGDEADQTSFTFTGGGDSEVSVKRSIIGGTLSERDRLICPYDDRAPAVVLVLDRSVVD